MGMARATGLSVTDAWAEPLSMIAQLRTMARKDVSGSIQTGLFFFQVEPIPSRRVVTGVQVKSPACGVSKFPKGKGFACPRCKALMDEVVTIAPLADQPGLSGYECPDCSYVTSVILQPKSR